MIRILDNRYRQSGADIPRVNRSTDVLSFLELDNDDRTIPKKRGGQPGNQNASCEHSKRKKRKIPGNVDPIVRFILERVTTCRERAMLGRRAGYCEELVRSWFNGNKARSPTIRTMRDVLKAMEPPFDLAVVPYERSKSNEIE